MRNIIHELTFIHDAIQKGGLAAALGGFLVIGLGLFLGKWAMVIAGSVVAFVVAVDFVIAFLLRGRKSD